MFAFIEGQVCEKANGTLILLSSGIGWQISCSMNTLQNAPAAGETMRCYTYLSVREDAVELFGFSSKEEKELFLQLTSVSGIGPKTALGVLGSMPIRDLSLAILLGDTAALSRAPGIGKKTAQRIALELKDKITQADVSAAADSAAPAVLPATDNVMEAVEALVALGYSPTEARNAVSGVRNQSDKPEELIRLALRAMAGM